MVNESPSFQEGDFFIAGNKKIRPPLKAVG